MAIFADWANAITDDSGLAIGAVQISVRNPINNALITIFSDAAGTVRANPFVTDATGVVRFFVDISVNSHIRVEAVKTGFDFTVWNSLFNNVRLAHGVPRGADRTVQYRRGDAFAGDADLTWDEATKRMAVAGIQGGLNIVPLVTPAAPTVTVIGTAGTTRYDYRITARSHTGETLASTITSITTGNAILTATNFNRISWPAVSGARDYRIWRVHSTGTPSTLGVIATVVGTTVDDTGLAGGGQAVPLFDTSGHVGIGTMTPAFPLDVRGIAVVGAGVDGSGLRIRMLDGSILRTFDPTNTGRPNSINFGVFGIGASGNLRAHGADHFYVNNDGTVTYMAIIGGNVGIGTATPLGALHVVGGTGASSWTYFGGNASGAIPNVHFTTGIAMAWNPSGGGGENVIAYGIGLGAAPRLDFNSWNGTVLSNVMSLRAGNVGVGITTPMHPIHHGSGAHLTAAGVWTNVSSRQLKTNFEAVSVLDKLANLSIQRYDYKKFEIEKDAEGKEKLDKNDQPIRKWKNKAVHTDKHISPVAEDMHTIFGVGSKDGLAAIDVAGVALQGVKELLARVIELEKRLGRVK